MKLYIWHTLDSRKKGFWLSYRKIQAQHIFGNWVSRYLVQKIKVPLKIQILQQKLNTLANRQTHINSIVKNVSYSRSPFLLSRCFCLRPKWPCGPFFRPEDGRLQQRFIFIVFTSYLDFNPNVCIMLQWKSFLQARTNLFLHSHQTRRTRRPASSWILWSSWLLEGWRCWEI